MSKVPKLVFFDHFPLNVRKRTKSTVMQSEMQKSKKRNASISVFSFMCSSKPIRGSTVNTETIANLLNSEIPTDYQLSGRLKVENKVFILALVNFKGLLKDTYS